jgi:hypothetical protein
MTLLVSHKAQRCEAGTDSKAGGPDYLLLFAQAKSIAEKL